MDSTTTQQLRSIIADEAAPMADRREAARHLTALNTSQVPMDIAPDDAEYARLRTPWERKTPSDAEFFDLPCFRELANGLSHDDAVARCREIRITGDRSATWQDTSLHRLERLAAIAAHMEDWPKPNFWTNNSWGPERVLANFDATGRLGSD